MRDFISVYSTKCSSNLKIFKTNTLLVKNSKIGLVVFGLILILFNMGQTANADVSANEDVSEKSGVFIPENEFIGYIDAGGVYTVAGAIKNTGDFPIVPTVLIQIQDGENLIQKSFTFVNIMPKKDLPFKVKFPNLTSQTIVLLEPKISYLLGTERSIPVEVLYDDSLMRHEDGHLTGRIINTGDRPITNLKVYALIHGLDNKVLDMGQSIERIDQILPGEIKEFTMYPDAAITDQISYYSCFAVGDTTVIPQFAIRNGVRFDYRYDSYTWYSNAKFNDEGTELSMSTLNSFPLETYANFEFPPSSADEKFQVYVNEKPKTNIQSKDEWGNWHVAFTVEPRESGSVLITGFSKDWQPLKEIAIPDWVRNNAAWWSEGKILDSDFASGIEFMIKAGIIKVPITESGDIAEEKKIPTWIKNNAGWWADDLISDDDFVKGIQYLVENKIIRV